MYLVCDPLTDLSETFGGLSIPKPLYLVPNSPSSSFASEPDGAKKISPVFM